MPKGYWVIHFRSITDQSGVDRYAVVAGPAIHNQGGRVIVGGQPRAVFEVGQLLRTAVVEFESVERALAAYQSAEYQAAVVHLRGAAERDVRILEGSAG